MLGGKSTVREKGIRVGEDKLADYITIGDMTIALPKGTPVGIAFKHPDDEVSDLTGRAIAFQRLANESANTIERLEAKREFEKLLRKF